MKNQTLLIGGAAALVVAGAGFYFYTHSKHALATVPVATPPAAYVAAAPQVKAAGPGPFDLNGAVKTVGEVVNGLSSFAKLFQ